jgi:RNA 2',3'-cyclic 3'-phosphodiesterase
MEQSRLFIAIELNDALRNELKHVQRHFKDAPVMQNVRWVAPENIHLTVKFLGNTSNTLVPALTEMLTRVASEFTQFEITARELGCFPNFHRPNNIWVGLKGALQTTALLAQRIETESAALGFPRDERGMTPHLTLGRVKQDTPRAERAAIGALVQNYPLTTFGSIRADVLYLISSDLRPTGPIYKVLVRAPF